VPACGQCNAAGRRDDEYFRLALALNERIASEPDVQAVIPEVLRSLQRAEATGLRNMFLRGAHQVDQVTPAGLYLGRTMAYNVDLDRLGTVCGRIVRGLWYKHHGSRLPDGYEVKAFATAGLRDIDAETFAETTRLLGSIIETTEPHSVGRIFSYVFHADERDHAISAWILLFYRNIVFLGFTGPARMANEL
jgi:hypothetical protein